MRKFGSIVAASVVVAAVCGAPIATGLVINADGPNVSTHSYSPPSNPSATQIASWTGTEVGYLTEVYKSDFDEGEAVGTDSGLFKDSYDTAFNGFKDEDDLEDPTGATITYEGGPIISGTPLWLLAKDGQNDPTVYLWNLTGLWDGQEDLVISGLWQTRGAISHLSILVGESTSVPDGGTTLALFGASLLGLAGLRRKLRK